MPSPSLRTLSRRWRLTVSRTALPSHSTLSTAAVLQVRLQEHQSLHSFRINIIIKKYYLLWCNTLNLTLRSNLTRLLPCLINQCLSFQWQYRFSHIAGISVLYTMLSHLLMYSQTKKCTTFMLLCIFFKWLCQMLFGQYGVKFVHNILGILIFLWYYENIWLYTAQKASGKTIWKNMHSSIKVVHFLVWLYNRYKLRLGVIGQWWCTFW